MECKKYCYNSFARLLYAIQRQHSSEASLDKGAERKVCASKDRDRIRGEKTKKKKKKLTRAFTTSRSRRGYGARNVQKARSQSLELLAFLHSYGIPCCRRALWICKSANKDNGCVDQRAFSRHSGFLISSMTRNGWPPIDERSIDERSFSFRRRAPRENPLPPPPRLSY